MLLTALAAVSGSLSIPIVARIVEYLLAPPTSTENIGQHIVQLTNMRKEFSDYLVERTSLTLSLIEVLSTSLNQAKMEADARLLTSTRTKDSMSLQVWETPSQEWNVS